ncbi:epsin-2-like isoform X2 [Centruroides sculpturatus]|uniref:epsin-2-like isoform X2 n=1 Tax=Centruroides sculpturatus TaxID=218467 RepID=UPI000C6E5967|nr:epsin-2-like isoform X2 [Centruroides sculpturatus]
MINVHGIRRNVKNVVRNYTEAQIKVREATSNDPWGPSSTLMSEIADLTYNVVAFSEIMQMIWKRLNDHGKNWRHVYKALVLLEYLIKTGSEKVTQQCKENIFAIQTLKDFQHIEDNKDQGLNVREKSKQLVSLLKDEERLKNERARALKAKERFAQATSHVGSDSVEKLGSPGYSDSHGSSPDGASLQRGALPSELECARPQTAGEEELQLQLALAMSKEEAEQEERLRRNDDLRLQMAITESQEDFRRNAHDKPGTQQSAMDDLLGISISGNNAEGKGAVATDPWGMPLMKPPQSADPWNSTSNRSVEPSNDPWDETATSTTVETPVQNRDLTSPQEKTEPDLFNLSGLKESLSTNSLRQSPTVSEKQLNNVSSRKTPESFLGANSSLVNLDALVSSQNPGQAPSANTNPFTPPVYNPFQATKPPPPTINQLRAQSQFPAFSSQTSSHGIISIDERGTMYTSPISPPANNPFI